MATYSDDPKVRRWERILWICAVIMSTAVLVMGMCLAEDAVWFWSCTIGFVLFIAVAIFFEFIGEIPDAG